MNVKISLTKPISLFAQFLLVWIIPALLTSFSKTPAELSRATGKGDIGGEVGFFLIKDFFGDTIPTQPATKLILIFALIFLLPLALAIPSAKIFSFFQKAFRFIGRASGLILTEEEKVELRKLKEQKRNKGITIDNANEKPKTFGDFNKIIKNVKEKEVINNKIEQTTNKKRGSKNSSGGYNKKIFRLIQV
ncbi:MAG: hypothetical protein KatS3mg085_190 [Candidatus Dojkabacteria bacterium]|nr:MAG: hypothetical protein KatS3mg085_190 [Candidatus Dojkabacteria bacterium]